MILNKSLKASLSAGSSQNHLQKLQRLDQKGQRAQLHWNTMKTLIRKFSKIAKKFVLKRTYRLIRL